MSPRHWRVLLVAGVSTSLLSGFALAGSSAATAPETSAPGTSTAGTAPGTTATDTTLPETPAVEILPPGEPYAGATLGEWDARWWQWAVSLPVPVNPNLDPTGERCGYGQSGPVFFLPGEFAPATGWRGGAAEDVRGCRGHGDLRRGDRRRVLDRRAATVLRARRGGAAGVCRDGDGRGLGRRGSCQRAGPRRSRRLPDQFAAVHAHLPRGQRLRSRTRCRRRGVGLVQLHHRPAATRRVRDRVDSGVRRRDSAATADDDHRRRGAPGDRARDHRRGTADDASRHRR